MDFTLPNHTEQCCPNCMRAQGRALHPSREDLKRKAFLLNRRPGQTTLLLTSTYERRALEGPDYWLQAIPTLVHTLQEYKDSTTESELVLAIAALDRLQDLGYTVELSKKLVCATLIKLKDKPIELTPEIVVENAEIAEYLSLKREIEALSIEEAEAELKLLRLKRRVRFEEPAQSNTVDPLVKESNNEVRD